MDCPIKSGNDRKGKMSENDTNKKVMAFVVVILRLDREYPKTRQPQPQTDCPIKSGNSRKGKMSENDIPPSHAPA